MQHASCPHNHGNPDGIMARLRSGTDAKHDAAESHPFQRAMVHGQLSLGSYLAYLSQLSHIHRALETGLRAGAKSDRRVAAVTEQMESRVPDLRSDLASLGAADADRPTAATALLVDRIVSASASSPLTLLGMHYVLEGSKNGGRFIARAVRRAYSLSDNRGTRYLDPHGEAQRDLWLAFKTRMDSQSFSPEDSSKILQGAGEMFDAIAQISQELLQAVPV